MRPKPNYSLSARCYISGSARMQPMTIFTEFCRVGEEEIESGGAEFLGRQHPDVYWYTIEKSACRSYNTTHRPKSGSKLTKATTPDPLDNAA